MYKVILKFSLLPCALQIFELTDTPVFEVERVSSSPTGRWLCLYGGRGVACVEVPRRAGRNGRFGGGAKTVTVR